MISEIDFWVLSWWRPSKNRDDPNSTGFYALFGFYPLLGSTYCLVSAHYLVCAHYLVLTIHPVCKHYHAIYALCERKEGNPVWTWRTDFRDWVESKSAADNLLRKCMEREKKHNVKLGADPAELTKLMAAFKTIQDALSFWPLFFSFDQFWFLGLGAFLTRYILPFNKIDLNKYNVNLQI